MTLRILVIEDEPAVSDLLVYNLHKAGYDPVTASDGRLALQMAQQTHPDLILLDLMLPEIDGLEVCRELRKTSQVPIIMITARAEEIDRVLGLELGADDYVCKPFGIRELLARIKAVLRRLQNEDQSTPNTSILHAPGGLTLNPESRLVFVQQQPLALTRLEFDLLQLLLESPGRVLTRQHLLEAAWGYDFIGDSRAVLLATAGPSTVPLNACAPKYAWPCPKPIVLKPYAVLATGLRSEPCPSPSDIISY
jgi:DNA-binding response OmpR family regulator